MDIATLRRHPRFRELGLTLRILGRNPSAVAGGVIIATMALLATFAPLLSPFDPIAINLSERLKPPAAGHLFGTDEMGRDIFSRVLHGARFSMSIGLMVVTIAGGIGTVIGATAGFIGGRIDNFIMRLMDVMLSFPSLVLAMALAAAMGPSLTLSFDAVFLVGYHGRAGTADAVIAHTFTGRIAEVKINDLSIGEIGISALLAGYHGVPVIFMTGDDAGCREGEALLPGLTTVAVKQGIGAYAAICSHPVVCRERIQKAAGEALLKCRQEGFPKPLEVAGSVTLQLRFTTASSVDRVIRMPRVKRLDGTTIHYRAADVAEAFAAFNTMADLVELTNFI